MAVIVRPQENSRKKTAGMDTKVTPSPKFVDTKMDTKPLNY
jgi:hypothetical protein